MLHDERYSRQILQWGSTQQRKLETATILVAGIGGLGATVSQLLVRAGVGKLYLADDGLIDWPDLNRQLLYDESDIGCPKLETAAQKLHRINSHVTIACLRGRIGDSFAIPADVSVIADCLDNYSSRFKLEASLPHGSFLLHGGIEGERGQVVTLQKGVSQPLAEIFSGVGQPRGDIPVSGDGVTILAGLMVNELFSLIFGRPKLLDRCLIVTLTDLHLAFLDV